MVSELKIKRIRQGLSQVELGLQSDIPQWRISLIERGIRPKKYEVRKISTALKVSTEEVFPNFQKSIGG